MSILILSVSNLVQLQHGIAAHHQFDVGGGTIGSHDTSWVLVDREKSIQPVHCEIRWIESQFCVVDHCGRTVLNDSLMNMGDLAPVSLREGDCLGIGAYRLLVSLQRNHGNQPLYRRSLRDLFDPTRCALEALVGDLPASAWAPEMPPPSYAVADICTVFEPDIGRDPLAALEVGIGHLPWPFAAEERP